MLSDPDHRYHYTFQQGIAECVGHDMQIATLDQMTEAFIRGYNYCICGWLSDGTARYPLHIYDALCGGGAPMINTCGWQSTYNVYCYKT